MYLRDYSKIIINIFSLLFLLLINIAGFANKYEQKGNNDKCFLSHSVEDSKCLRPFFLKTTESNISVAIEKENIFPSQNRFEVELAKQVEGFVFGETVSEYDFSSQKSYIKLGGIVCVGKVISKINKSNTSYFSTTKYIKKF